jgi:hypothetical protein
MATTAIINPSDVASGTKDVKASAKAEPANAAATQRWSMWLRTADSSSIDCAASIAMRPSSRWSAQASGGRMSAADRCKFILRGQKDGDLMSVKPTARRARARGPTPTFHCSWTNGHFGHLVTHLGSVGAARPTCLCVGALNGPRWARPGDSPVHPNPANFDQARGHELIASSHWCNVRWRTDSHQMWV